MNAVGEALENDPVLGRTVLGRYRVIKPLAQGGMGVVYLGRTEGAAGFSRPVVIKRVLPQLLTDQSVAKMFVREAKILSNLNHPGIVGVVDFGEEDDAYVMVLDYVHGYDAGAWLLFHRKEKRRIPQAVAVQIAIRVLEALHYAHSLKRPDGTSLQVIHRDISPGNILLDTEGQVRLLDFGIARIAEEANEYRTQEATFKGKLGYAHPSLLSRQDPSPQTDVYSTAVVLFQLLTGVNPFRGKTTAETLGRIVNDPLPRLREYLSDAPAALEILLLKAMSRDLGHAYPTAQAMADALRQIKLGDGGDVGATMGRLFAQDFFGDMPQVLQLQPLEERDSAWRTSIVEAPLRSTPPRPPDASPSEAPTVYRPDGTTPAHATELGAMPTATGGHKTIALALAGLALAVAAVAGVLLFKDDKPDPAARYVVVSKEAETAEPTAVTANPEPKQAPSAASTAQAPPESEPSTTATAPAKSGSRKQAAASPGGPEEPTEQLLTRRFSRNQGRVQSCFTRNEQLAHQYQSVQIAFKVDTAGRVQSASLVPAAVQSTALGQCLLGVARSASFGSLTKSATFRIPVQARVR